MNAYLDTSFLVAVAFREEGWRRCKRILARCRAVFSSELLVAELLAAARREGIRPKMMARPLAGVTIVLPDRAIRPEIDRVLDAGYLRGADLWHVACACYLASSPRDLAFLSLDDRQRAVASSLGFATPG